MGKLFIKINIKSNEFKKEIIIKDNVFYINGFKKNIDVQKFTSKLFCIISCWKEEIIGQRTTNDYIYSIEIENDGEKAKFLGVNKFPQNYYEFTKLLAEVGV